MEKKISEFAWNSTLSKRQNEDFKFFSEGITELIQLINSGALVIGHNIKEFDLKILSKYGACPSNEFIWDTFEVEMLLNPFRFSYGLKAKHNAVDDSTLVFELFKINLLG
ncbi:MAG: hypothetical protein IPP71_10040 [Bacteroidetes bacterium]|nr:hypothetical protein [Bacteroidota bacterium]